MWARLRGASFTWSTQADETFSLRERVSELGGFDAEGGGDARVAGVEVESRAREMMK